MFSDVPWLSVAPTGHRRHRRKPGADGTVNSTGWPRACTTRSSSSRRTIRTTRTSRCRSLLWCRPTSRASTRRGTYIDPDTGNDYVSDRAFSSGDGDTRAADPLDRQRHRRYHREPSTRTRTGMTEYGSPFRTVSTASTCRSPSSRSSAPGPNLQRRARGRPVICSLDVCPPPAACYIALDRRVIVEVTDGVLDLRSSASSATSRSSTGSSSPRSRREARSLRANVRQKKAPPPAGPSLIRRTRQPPVTVERPGHAVGLVARQVADERQRARRRRT